MINRVGGTQAVMFQRGLSESAMRLHFLTQVGVVTRAAEEVQQPANGRSAAACERLCS